MLTLKDDSGQWIQTYRYSGGILQSRIYRVPKTDDTVFKDIISQDAQDFAESNNLADVLPQLLALARTHSSPVGPLVVTVETSPENPSRVYLLISATVSGTSSDVEDAEWDFDYAIVNKFDDIADKIMFSCSQSTESSDVVVAADRYKALLAAEQELSHLQSYTEEMEKAAGVPRACRWAACWLTEADVAKLTILAVRATGDTETH